jgi:hypothetical protein
MIALGVVGAVATFAYWTIWFGVNRDWLASAHTQSYYVFENAFPLADAWMTFCLGMAAFTLWRRRPSALLWLLLSGSAAIYLGAMDVLFDLENGIYMSPWNGSGGDLGGVVVEVLINIFCLAGGAAAVRFGWRHRAYFHLSGLGDPGSKISG